MSVYGGPYADGSKKRVYVNPQNGKTTPSNYGNDYKFNNKPNSLQHWAEYLHEAGLDQKNEAIVHIDPDFLFLKKFAFPDSVDAPSPGKPVAA
eukprot:7624418-Ditylum_brightwellii.AAC.1